MSNTRKAKNQRTTRGVCTVDPAHPVGIVQHPQTWRPYWQCTVNRDDQVREVRRVP